MFQIRKEGTPVLPTSKQNIRNFATVITQKVRSVIDYDTVLPITHMLDRFGTDVFPGLSVEILPKDSPLMKHVWAYTNPNKKTIYIREDTYDKACEGDAQSRFTIAHEMGHLFLNHRFDLGLPRKDSNKELPLFYDAEWQADTFAAELLMPVELAKGKTCTEVQKLFNVSASAAQTRVRKLAKEFQNERPL